jgi:hypothetical protein
MCRNDSISSTQAHSAGSAKSDADKAMPSEEGYPDEYGGTVEVSSTEGCNVSLFKRRIEDFLKVSRGPPPVEPSPLEDPFVPAIAPVGARFQFLREKVDNLVAKSQQKCRPLQGQTRTAGASTATGIASASTPWEQSQNFSGPKSYSWKICTREEQDQLNQKRCWDPSNHTMDPIFLANSITPARVLTNLFVAASSCASAPVILDSQPTVVIVRDADVIILYRMGNMKCTVPTVTALAACLRKLRSPSLGQNIPHSS